MQNRKSKLLLRAALRTVLYPYRLLYDSRRDISSAAGRHPGVLLLFYLAR